MDAATNLHFNRIPTVLMTAAHNGQPYADQVGDTSVGQRSQPPRLGAASAAPPCQRHLSPHARLYTVASPPNVTPASSVPLPLFPPLQDNKTCAQRLHFSPAERQKMKKLVALASRNSREEERQTCADLQALGHEVSSSREGCIRPFHPSGSSKPSMPNLNDPSSGCRRPAG